MEIEGIAQLRERNQLTLPERVARAIDAKPGDDFLFTYDDAHPKLLNVRVLPQSYAGIAAGLFGRTGRDRAAYIAEERASWDEGSDPGRAADGTPFLTLEESRRTYRQTDVTPERYEREPKLRWPRCDVCGRSIANMREHRRKHATKILTDAGISTDPAQVERTRRRVRKWRATRALRGASRTR